MHIHFIPEVVRSDALPFPDDPGHNPQYHIICYWRIQEDVIVTSDYIAVWEHLKNTVKDVLIPEFI